MPYYNLAGCTSVTTGVNWETAKEHCRTQNDSLVDIRDIQNHLFNFLGNTTDLVLCKRTLYSLDCVQRLFP